MLKIAVITFHGAHNYGSMLQTYALQAYIQKLAEKSGVKCEYDVLNFRTDLQKELYKVLNLKSVKGFIKSMMALPYYKLLKKQSYKFEEFLSSELNTTYEVNSLEELRRLASNYDVIISGSDQIWNVRAADFNFAYLLDGMGCKKISYAASLGPLDIDWSRYDKEHYKALLQQYSAISLREEKSKKMIDELLGDDGSQINVDPTLLLEKEQWQALQSDMGRYLGKYILFYCLEPNKNHIRIAKLLSEKMGIPVVATKYRGKKDYFNPFIKRYDAGPKDFLSLVDHAEAVVTSSFHGTVFSLIYGKPFVCIDGLRDGRISSLLKSVGAESCAVSREDINIEIPALSDVEFVKNVINDEREKSKEYLLKNIF